MKPGRVGTPPPYPPSLAPASSFHSQLPPPTTAWPPPPGLLFGHLGVQTSPSPGGLSPTSYPLLLSNCVALSKAPVAGLQKEGIIFLWSV